MTQQINLFDTRFRKQKPHFSAATMALALGAVFVLALVIEQLYAYQNRAMQATLAQNEKRAAELRDQTLRFYKEFGEQGRSNALSEEVARVDEQLRLRRGLLEGMQGGVGGNVEGFSPYLTALARRTMNGVWLTGVQIATPSTASPSGDLVLKGRVLDSALVPAYIRQLNQEPLFRGRSVNELRLAARLEPPAKSEPAKRYVEFSLQIPLFKGAS
jgi:hypothetical protein